MFYCLSQIMILVMHNMCALLTYIAIELKTACTQDDPCFSIKTFIRATQICKPQKHARAC